MSKKQSSNFQIPDELKDVATTGDVNALEQRVEKCYSAERYEEFQEAVRKIALETIEGAGRDKIKSHAKESAKEYSQENGWTKLTFWLPTIISALVAIIAVVALFLKK